MDAFYERVICMELRQRLELDSIIIVLQCNIVAVVWWCFKKAELHHVALDGSDSASSVFIAVGGTETDDSLMMLMITTVM